MVVYPYIEEVANINGHTFYIKGNQLGLYSEPQIIATINKEGGLWTLDEPIKEVPEKLTKGVVNPALPRA